MVFILCLPFVLLRQKGGEFLILGRIFVFVPKCPKGEFVGLFYWLHSVEKKTLPYQGHSNSRRLSEYYCKIINQERKGLNMERYAVYLLRKASAC
jgi:hypothetical protein